MISEPTYLAAKVVADQVAAHLTKQANLYPPANYIPDIPVIETLIDTAFWASLRREEGYEPKISLAFAPPGATGYNLVFQYTQRFTPYSLVKLSPAVVQPGIHLGVWQTGDNLYIWGTTRELPAHSMVLEVVEAGLLVVKQTHHDRTRKFTNIAVLKGNQINVIDDIHWGLTDYPGMLATLLGTLRLIPDGPSGNLLVQLAVAMRNHGRGALLLVVPDDSEAWLHSIVQPIKYLIEPQDVLPISGDTQTANAYPQLVSAIGGYSAIDGATVITRGYRLLAFGTKVARSPHSMPVAQIMLTEPVAGSTLQLLDAANIGGTRHLAAAQFVNDQRDSLAMVASQDGAFTVFSWSEKQQLVHGHRIDTLLM